MSLTKKILVIEDEESVRENVLELLKAEGYTVRAAENGRVGLELALAEPPDLILCDITMPEMDGFSVLEELRQVPALAATPFIFLSARTEKTDLRHGMELGADDYLTKPFTRAELLSAIAARWQRQVSVAQHLDTELKRLEEKFTYFLQYDSLTGLPNRNTLRERIDQALLSREQGAELAVLVLGLDQFTQLNGSLGQNLGDLLLTLVVERLHSMLDKAVILARLEAAQFAIVPTGLNDRQQVCNFAGQLQQALAAPFVLNHHQLFITASIGIATSPSDGTTSEVLLSKAEAALFYVRGQGGNNYQFYFQQMQFEPLNRLKLESDLRLALERGEFELYYQPQLDAKSGNIIGTEALLRWRHPEDGLISPARFIPVAEETGLIIPLGAWVLRSACQQLLQWQALGFSFLRVAVNLSGRQLNQPDLQQSIAVILAEVGLSPAYLELELTESILVQGLDQVNSVLQELKALGVKVSLDDFGTGYSSLSYLKHLSLDVLKIDQSFVRNLMLAPENQAIIASIIQMAHSLNLKVVAEGVETEEEFRFLSQQRCDGLQGYFFGRPVSALDFEKILKSGKRLATF